jgi:hypothetical protein
VVVVDDRFYLPPLLLIKRAAVPQASVINDVAVTKRGECASV